MQSFKSLVSQPSQKDAEGKSCIVLLPKIGSICMRVCTTQLTTHSLAALTAKWQAKGYRVKTGASLSWLTYVSFDHHIKSISVRLAVPLHLSFLFQMAVTDDKSVKSSVMIAKRITQGQSLLFQTDDQLHCRSQVEHYWKRRTGNIQQQSHHCIVAS